MDKGTTATGPASARRRIGINAHLLAGEDSYRRAGVSRYIESLLRSLLSEDSEGDYTVFLNGRSHLSFSLQPWREKRSRLPANGPWLRVLWEQCMLPLEILFQRIELLHSPVNVQPLVLPCKGVVTVTDLSFMLFPESYPAFQRLYQRLFTRLSVQRATHLIAISAHTAQDVCRFFGAPAEKISVTHPGVDAAYQPIRDPHVLFAFRQKRHLPEKFFLFVGTLEPRKNLLTLLQAYAAFRQSVQTGHKLVLVGGKGWLYQPLFAAVEELGLQPDVILPGFVPEDELPLWYNAADVFVYPSLYEGFGLPPLEAMACGTPVIVSNTSSLPEVVGDAGLRVAPHRPEEWTDALSRLCNDGDLRSSLVSRGLERARGFSWARMARATIQVYRSVLTGGA